MNNNFEDEDSHRDLMLGQGIYLRAATETGAGLLHSLRCVFTRENCW